MDDFNDDPLDLLEDDGDGVNETCLFFDAEDEKSGSKPPGPSGCCIVFLVMGATVGSVGIGLVKYFA